MLISLSLLLSAAQAACPADPSVVEADVDRVLGAWKIQDQAMLQSAAESLEQDVACVDAVISTELAARIHLASMVIAWGRDQNLAEGLLAAQGIYALDPDYEPDPELAPEGGEMRLMLDRAPSMLDGATWSELPSLAGGAQWAVDGELGVNQAPTSRYALLQRADEAGVDSWYLRGTMPQEIFQIAQSSDDRKRPERGGMEIDRTFALASGCAGLLAAGSLAAASATRSRFNDYDPADPNLDAGDGLYRLNRITGFGGYTLGAAAVGLGVVAVWGGR